jgi:hypothetical protein
MIIMD